jgi:orotate phosphoribosyltransferase
VTSLADAPTFRAHLGDPTTLADYLGRSEVLRHGHFCLLSGLHTEWFLAFSRIAIDAAAVQQLAATLAAVVGPWSPTAVLAPSTAGVALGGVLARRLGTPLHLASLDGEGRANGIIGTPGLNDQRVLLVNDIVTTGRGLQALADVVRAAGATVAGAAWFASRADVDVQGLLGAPGAHLVTLDLPAVPADQCRGCAAHQPVEEALDLN